MIDKIAGVGVAAALLLTPLLMKMSGDWSDHDAALAAISHSGATYVRGFGRFGSHAVPGIARLAVVTNGQHGARIAAPAPSRGRQNRAGLVNSGTAVSTTDDTDTDTDSDRSFDTDFGGQGVLQAQGGGANGLGRGTVAANGNADGSANTGAGQTSGATTAYTKPSDGTIPEAEAEQATTAPLAIAKSPDAAAPDASGKNTQLAAGDPTGPTVTAAPVAAPPANIAEALVRGVELSTGPTSESAGATKVPEPSMIVLFALAAGILPLMRPRAPARRLA